METIIYLLKGSFQLRKNKFKYLAGISWHSADSGQLALKKSPREPEITVLLSLWYIFLSLFPQSIQMQLDFLAPKILIARVS